MGLDCPEKMPLKKIETCLRIHVKMAKNKLSSNPPSEAVFPHKDESRIASTSKVEVECQLSPTGQLCFRNYNSPLSKRTLISMGFGNTYEALMFSFQQRKAILYIPFPWELR